MELSAARNKKGGPEGPPISERYEERVRLSARRRRRTWRARRRRSGIRGGCRPRGGKQNGGRGEGRWSCCLLWLTCDPTHRRFASEGPSHHGASRPKRPADLRRG